MKDWHKERTLRAKKTVDFIRQHPEGVTAEDFRNAGVSMCGIDRLMKLKLISGTQVKEPERGPRSYHWLWKPDPLPKITGDSA